MTTTCTMILGDCLEVMPKIKAQASVAVVDLPFGVSGCAWDVRLNLDHFWSSLIPCLSPKWCAAFACTQPFTTDVIQSNRKMLKYDLIWLKRRSTGFFNAKKSPMRSHESIVIMGNSQIYNPQMVSGKRFCVTSKKAKDGFFGKEIFIDRTKSDHKGTLRYPKSVLEFDESELRRDSLNGHTGRILHPTQKPVALLDWLIRTYSNAGDMIFDPASGSGVTAVSAIKNGRNVTCIEKDVEYFEKSVERVRQSVTDGGFNVKIEVQQ